MDGVGIRPAMLEIGERLVSVQNDAWLQLTAA
jgi:hypothetical protein